VRENMAFSTISSSTTRLDFIEIQGQMRVFGHRNPTQRQHWQRRACGTSCDQVASALQRWWRDFGGRVSRMNF